MVPAVTTEPSPKPPDITPTNQTSEALADDKDLLPPITDPMLLPATDSNGDLLTSLNITRDVDAKAVANVLRQGPSSLSLLEWQNLSLPVLEHLLQNQNNVHPNSLGAVISAVYSSERSAFRLLERIIQESDEQNRTLATRMNRPLHSSPLRNATEAFFRHLNASVLVDHLSEQGNDPGTLVLKSAFPEVSVSRLSNKIWFESWLYKKESADFDPVYGPALVRLFFSTSVHRQTSVRQLRSFLNTADPLAPFIPLHSLAELNSMLPLPGKDVAFYQRICSTYPQSGLCQLMVYNSLFRDGRERAISTMEPLAPVFMDPSYMPELQNGGYISKTVLQRIAGKYTSLPMSFVMSVRPLVALYWNGTTPPVPFLPALDSKYFESLSYQKLMKRSSDLGKVYHLLNPAQKHKLARLLAQGGDQVPAFVPNRLPARDLHKYRQRLVQGSCRTNVLDSQMPFTGGNSLRSVLVRSKFSAEKSCLRLLSALTCREVLAFNSTNFWTFLSEDPTLSSATSRCVLLKAKHLVTGNPRARDLQLLLSLQLDEFLLLKSSLLSVDMDSLQMFVQLTQKSGLCRSFFTAVDSSAHLLSHEKASQYARLAAECLQLRRGELNPQNISAIRNLAAYLPVQMIENFTVDAISSVFGMNPHAHPSVCRAPGEKEILRSLILRKFRDPSTWAEPHLYHMGCLVEVLTDSDFSSIDSGVKENLVDFWATCLYVDNNLQKKTTECKLSAEPKNYEDYPDLLQDERVTLASTLESAVKSTLRQIAEKEASIKRNNITQEAVTGTELLRGSPSFYDPADFSTMRYDELMNAMDAVSSLQLSTAEAGAMWGVIQCRWNHPRLVPGYVLRQLGSVSLGIPPEHLKQLNLNNPDVVSSMSAVKGYTSEQIRALATAVLRRYRRRYPTDLFHVESLGQIVCGFPEKYLRTALRPEILALASPAFFKALRVCHIEKLNIIAQKVVSKKSYGPVQSWTPNDVEVLGPVVAGLDPELLRQLPPASLQGLPPDVAERFNPEQVIAVLPAAFYMQCDTIQSLDNIYALPEIPQHCAFQAPIRSTPESILYDPQQKRPADGLLLSTGQVSTLEVATSMTPSKLTTLAAEEASSASPGPSGTGSSKPTSTPYATAVTTGEATSSTKSNTVEDTKSGEHQMLWQQDSPELKAEPLTSLNETKKELPGELETPSFTSSATLIVPASSSKISPDDLLTSTSVSTSEKVTPEVSPASPRSSLAVATFPSSVSLRQMEQTPISTYSLWLSSTTGNTDSTDAFSTTLGNLSTAKFVAKLAEMTTASNVTSPSSSVGFTANIPLSTITSETIPSTAASGSTKKTSDVDAGVTPLRTEGPAGSTVATSEVQETSQSKISTLPPTERTSVFFTEVSEEDAFQYTGEPSSSTKETPEESLLTSDAPSDVHTLSPATQETESSATDDTHLREEASVSPPTTDSQPSSLEAERTAAKSSTRLFTTEEARLDFKEVESATTDSPVSLRGSDDSKTTASWTLQTKDKASIGSESVATLSATVDPLGIESTAAFSTLDRFSVTDVTVEGTTNGFDRATQSSHMGGSKSSEETPLTVSYSSPVPSQEASHRATTGKAEPETYPGTSYGTQKDTARPATMLAESVTSSTVTSRHDYPTFAQLPITETDAEVTKYDEQATTTVTTAVPTPHEGSSPQFGHSSPQSLHATDTSIAQVTELAAGASTTRTSASSTAAPGPRPETTASVPTAQSKDETSPWSSPSSEAPPEAISVEFSWVTEPLTTYPTSLSTPKPTSTASSKPPQGHPTSSTTSDSFKTQTEDARLSDRTTMKFSSADLSSLSTDVTFPHAETSATGVTASFPRAFTTESTETSDRFQNTELSSKVPDTSHTLESSATQGAVIATTSTNGSRLPDREASSTGRTESWETSVYTSESTPPEATLETIDTESNPSEIPSDGLAFRPTNESSATTHSVPQESVKATTETRTSTRASTSATRDLSSSEILTTVAEKTTQRKRPTLSATKVTKSPPKEDTMLSYTPRHPSASPASVTPAEATEAVSRTSPPVGFSKAASEAARVEFSRPTAPTTEETTLETAPGVTSVTQSMPTKGSSAQQPVSVPVTFPASSEDHETQAYVEVGTSPWTPELAATTTVDLQDSMVPGTSPAPTEESGLTRATDDTTESSTSVQLPEAAQDASTRQPVTADARETLPGATGATAAELRISTLSTSSTFSVIRGGVPSTTAVQPAISEIPITTDSGASKLPGSTTTTTTITETTSGTDDHSTAGTSTSLKSPGIALSTTSEPLDSWLVTVTQYNPTTTMVDETFPAYETTTLGKSSRSAEPMETTLAGFAGKTEGTVTHGPADKSGTSSPSSGAAEHPSIAAVTTPPTSKLDSAETAVFKANESVELETSSQRPETAGTDSELQIQTTETIPTAPGRHSNELSDVESLKTTKADRPMTSSQSPELVEMAAGESLDTTADETTQPGVSSKSSITTGSAVEVSTDTTASFPAASATDAIGITHAGTDSLQTSTQQPVSVDTTPVKRSEDVETTAASPVPVSDSEQNSFSTLGTAEPQRSSSPSSGVTATTAADRTDATIVTLLATSDETSTRKADKGVELWTSSQSSGVKRTTSEVSVEKTTWSAHHSGQPTATTTAEITRQTMSSQLADSAGTTATGSGETVKTTTNSSIFPGSGDTLSSSAVETTEESATSVGASTTIPDEAPHLKTTKWTADTANEVVATGISKTEDLSTSTLSPKVTLSSAAESKYPTPSSEAVGSTAAAFTVTTMPTSPSEGSSETSTLKEDETPDSTVSSHAPKAPSTSPAEIAISTVTTSSAAFTKDSFETSATESKGREPPGESSHSFSTKSTTSRLPDLPMSTTRQFQIVSETSAADARENAGALETSPPSAGSVDPTVSKVQTTTKATIPTAAEDSSITFPSDVTEATDSKTSQVTGMAETTATAELLFTAKDTLGSTIAGFDITSAGDSTQTTDSQFWSHPAATETLVESPTTVDSEETTAADFHRTTGLLISPDSSETPRSTTGKLPDHPAATTSATLADETMATESDASIKSTTSRLSTRTTSPTRLQDDTSFAATSTRDLGTTLAGQLTESAVGRSSPQPSKAEENPTTHLQDTTVSITPSTSAEDDTIDSFAYGTTYSASPHQSPGSTVTTTAALPDHTATTVPSTSFAGESSTVDIRSTTSPGTPSWFPEESETPAAEIQTVTATSVPVPTTTPSAAGSFRTGKTIEATTREFPGSTAAEFTENMTTAARTDPTAEFASSSPVPYSPEGTKSAAVGLENATMTSIAATSTKESKMSAGLPTTPHSPAPAAPPRRSLLVTVQIRHPVTNQVITVQGFDPVLITEEGRCQCTCPSNAAIVPEDLAISGPQLN